MDLVVAVSGHAASGKSTLAAALVADSDAEVVAFGEVVRARARGAGLDSGSRLVLMDVGHQWATQDPGGLCAEVLGGVGDARVVIIDGVRHAAVLDTLRALVGADCLFHVAVDAPRDVLRSRLEGDAEPWSHPSERDVELLRRRADLEVQSTRPVDELVALVTESLAARSGAAADIRVSSKSSQVAEAVARRPLASTSSRTRDG